MMISDIELPTARRRLHERELLEAQREHDQRASQLRQTLEEISELESALPGLDQLRRELEASSKRLKEKAAHARDELMRIAGEQRAASNEVIRARKSLNAAQAIAEPLDEHARARLERVATYAGYALQNANEERERLSDEIEQLERGRTPRPQELDTFRGELEIHGITSALLADEVEVENETSAAVEAALHQGVWTLVVPHDRYSDAVVLAREHGYRLPIARAGTGEPIGILSAAHGLPEALAYLQEIDLPLDEDGEAGVSIDGLVRGRHWAHFRAPKHPALGQRARQAALERARVRIQELDHALPRLRDSNASAHHRLGVVVEGLTALGRIKDLIVANEVAVAAFQEQRERDEDVTGELDQLGPRLGRVGSELSTKREVYRKALGRSKELQPRVQKQNDAVREIEDKLAQQPLTAEQASLVELAPIEALEHELNIVELRLAEFSEEDRSPLTPIQRDDQKIAVSQAEDFLQGREDTVKDAKVELERARKRYDEHIRRTMQTLNRSFKEICQRAGMDGEIKIEPSPSVQDEWSLDVRVAHTPDEPKRSYQSRDHSGGQRAKISILLLLAAMSIEGAADLLIMDEHIAHLDSRNIDYVAEVMSALKDKVQFLLATPTNAEAGRLTWCDHQLAFLPRPEGDPYSPPIRLFTRMPEEEESHVAAWAATE